MTNYKILFLSLIISTTSFAASNKQQMTTRLKSTAGVGIGSLLLDEASILNPAPLAFFKIGALYYQQTKSSFNEATEKNSLIIASDAKGAVGGSISYHQTEEGKLISVSLARPAGERSALGLTYHYDKNNDGENSQYITVGISHAVSESFTLGFVADDLTNEFKNLSKIKIGGQYMYADFIGLMADFGTGWRDDPASKLTYGAAIQFKLFSDLYLRMGINRNKINNTKTSGIGISWVSPRLVFNLALSREKLLADNSEVKDTAFSVSYKF